MKTKDAIEHFKWRYTKSGMNVSEKDITSLNTIIIALNEVEQHKLNDNLNFCKLFIYSFKKMCLTNAINNNYEFVDIKMIHDKLQGVLRMDANSHIDSLHKELKGIEIQRLINNNKLNTESILNLSTKKDVNTSIRSMLSEFIDNN